MAKYRLTSDGLVDIDFTTIRLTSGGLVQGSPTSTPPPTFIPPSIFQNANRVIK